MKILLFLLTFALFTIAGFGQAGTLDTTFGIGGKVIPNPNFSDYAGKMALQPDGKIVVAGTDLNGYFLVIRYLSNGSIDEGFGINGRVITAFGTTSQPGDAYATSVAVQPDGKIVVVGPAYLMQGLAIAVARYHPDGSLDSSFSDDGRVTMSFGNGVGVEPSAMALHEGKIIVAGLYLSTSSTRVALVRFNTNGSPDSTFSQNGWLTATFDNIPGYSTTARNMVVQPDGRIIVVGDYETNSPSNIPDFVLMRFKPDGSLDSTFSDDGKLRTGSEENLSLALAVALQPDGKILAAGYSFVDNMALARYLPDGTPDSTFGTAGRVTVTPDPNKGVGVFALALQTDGKIVAAGASVTASPDHADFALVRYNTNGTLDPAFGVNGGVTQEFDPYNSQATSVLLQSDGKILALGSPYSDMGSIVGPRFVLARYLSGLSVGVLDFSITPQHLLIYPNPLQSDATLQYELAQEETITIQLTDLQGHLLQTLISQEKREAGVHREPVRLPETLPAGHYVLSIGTTRGIVSVQVVK